MGCLWCEEEELAIRFIKIFAEDKLDNKAEILRKALPDLFLCLNCLYEYHRLKVKVIKSREERKVLLEFEYKRTESHLKKVKDIQKDNDYITEMLLVDSSIAAPMRNPLLEMLCFPYLCLTERLMNLFVVSLEWIIDHVQGSFFEPDAKYPGLYLLLIHTSKKIKDWSAESIRMMPMISHEDFYVFRPLFNALLNIVSSNQASSSEVVLDKINDTTVIPHHLYDPLEMTTLWYAYGVIFNSLQSRVLKILLESNKNLFEHLFVVLNDENSVFWFGLSTFEILLEKLGSSFWLFSSGIATDMFSTIVNNPMFTSSLNQLSKSHESKGLMFAENEVSIENMFSWFLPFLKTSLDLDICGSVSFKVTQFLLVNIEKYKTVQILYSTLLKSLITIVSYLSEEHCVHVLIGHSNHLARILIAGCQKEDAAYNLLNTLVVKSLGFKIITPDVKLKFTSNVKKMQQGKSFDFTIIRDILEKIFKETPKMNRELVDDKESIVKQLKLQKVIGDTAEYPIILDEDSDVIGQIPDVPVIDISDEESINVNKEIKHEQDFYGSKSPVEVSEVESEEESTKEVSNVDFSVENSCTNSIQSGPSCSMEVINVSEKRDIPNPKQKFEAMRSRIGSLNREIYNFHKKMLQPELVPKFAQNVSQESPVTEKEDLIYDRSSDVSNTLKKQLPVMKATSGGIKQRCSSLRRERIEKDLTTPLAPITAGLPVMKSRNKINVRHFYKNILCWKAKWLEEKRDELELEQTVDAVPLTFNSFDEYVKVFWPLLLMETWSQAVRDWSESGPISADFVIDGIDDICGFGKMCYIRCSYYEEHQDAFHQRYKGCPLDEDLVFLTFERQDCVEKVFGIVECSQFGVAPNRDQKIKKQYGLYNLTVMIDAISHLHSFKSVAVTRVTSLTTVLRQFNGLIEFQNSVLAKDVLKPFRKTTFQLTDNKIEQSIRLRKLNRNQFWAASAVSHCVLKNDTEIPRILLLQGPPGTGKSYTVKTIITHLLQEWSKSSRGTDRNRILVCAPSNAAVDEIVKRLVSSPPAREDKATSISKASAPFLRRNVRDLKQLRRQQQGNCGDFNLLRLGRKKQVDSHVAPYTMEYLVEAKLKKISLSLNKDHIQKELRRISQLLDQLDNACVKLKMSSDDHKKKKYQAKMIERATLQKKYDEYNRLLEKASGKLDMKGEEARCRHNLLLQADIICCTLSGAGSKSMIQTFKRKYTRVSPPFSCVIIDEAGQCCEPDALIPLQYFGSKLVLVGDPAQLPATVLSQKATRYNYGQSLFERIFHALTIVNEQGDRPAILLNIQYRMAPGICSFPSQRFYNNELLPAKEIYKRKTNPLKEYVVLNILNSTEERSHFSGSMHNPNERNYVMSLCADILETFAIPQQAVSVITPYRKQVSLLCTELRGFGLDRIKVNTVDGFQGQESDIVLLSCVRGTNYQSNIGFLKHPQRMNVALTRARKSLIILCNCETLEVDDDWKALIENARQRNLLYNVYDVESAKRAIYHEGLSKLTLTNGQAAEKITEDCSNSVPSMFDKDVHTTNPTSGSDHGAKVEGQSKFPTNKESVSEDLLDHLQVPIKVLGLKVPIVDGLKDRNDAEVTNEQVKSKTEKLTHLQEEDRDTALVGKSAVLDKFEVVNMTVESDVGIDVTDPSKTSLKMKRKNLEESSEKDHKKIKIDHSESANLKKKKKKKKKSESKEKHAENGSANELSTKQKVVCDKMQAVDDVEIKVSLKLLQKKLDASTDPKEKSELRSILDSLCTLRKDNGELKPKNKPEMPTNRKVDQLLVQSAVVDSLHPSLSSPTGSCVSIDSEASSNDFNGQRKWKPSSAYFNLPHRHTDGTYCEKECTRVLEREKRKRSLPVDIPWKLILLDRDVNTHLEMRQRSKQEQISKEQPLPLVRPAENAAPPDLVSPAIGTFPDERPKRPTDPRKNKKINHQESEPMEVTTLEISPILLNAPVDFPASTFSSNRKTISSAGVESIPNLQPKLMKLDNNKTGLSSIGGSKLDLSGGPSNYGYEDNSVNLTAEEYRTNYVAGFTAGILEKRGVTGDIKSLVNMISTSVLNTDALENIIQNQHPTHPPPSARTNMTNSTTKNTYPIPVIGSSRLMPKESLPKDKLKKKQSATVIKGIPKLDVPSGVSTPNVSGQRKSGPSGRETPHRNTEKSKKKSRKERVSKLDKGKLSVTIAGRVSRWDSEVHQEPRFHGKSRGRDESQICGDTMHWF